MKENTMRVRWENIIIPALIIMLIVLLFHMPEALRRLLCGGRGGGAPL